MRDNATCIRNHISPPPPPFHTSRQGFLMRDNATCIRPVSASALRPPAWGGAYAGSKVRCAASHDLRAIAQPDACAPRAEPPPTGARPIATAATKAGPPYQPGTSFEPFDRFPPTIAVTKAAASLTWTVGM